MSLFNRIFGNSDQQAQKTDETSDPERNFQILKDDGVRARNMREMPFAIQCFQEALKIKDDAETLSYLAEAYLLTGQTENALPYLEKLTATEPDNLQLLLTAAHAALKCQQYDKAQTWLEQAGQAAPDEPHVLYLEAQLLHERHNDIMAVAKVTQALMHDEKLLMAYELRAKILLSMGQPAEAVKDTTRLTAEAPDQEDYQLLHGQALAAAQQPEAAEAAFQAALEANPFSLEAPLHLAQLYSATHRLDKALQTCNDLIEAHPDYAEAYKVRGAVKMALHNEAGAADDLKKSLSLKPQQVEEMTGEFTNMENKMNERYRNLNPYGF